jgi:hypothetical protein
MTSTPSTALERHEPRHQAPAILDERAQASLRFRARSLAALDSRISKIDDPADREKMAVGLAITLDSLGLSIDPIQARKLHLIGGDWTPSAQLMVELVQRRGHDIIPVAMTRERAVFRGRRFGQGEPITIEYSIDDARESGALDEWVELWEKGGNGKNYLAGRHVLAVDGEPTGTEAPDWARKLIAAGKVKRNEAWFKYRIDMLANRCVKRLAKWMAADALNGYGPVAFGGLDDDVVTVGEVVDDEPEGEEPPADDLPDAEIVEPVASDRSEQEDDPPKDPDPDPGPAMPTAVDPRQVVPSVWIDDVLEHCTSAAPEGVAPGALAAAITRHITGGERSELATIRRGAEQTKFRTRFVEYTEGRWQVEIAPDGTATLVEAEGGES